MSSLCPVSNRDSFPVGMKIWVGISRLLRLVSIKVTLTCSISYEKRLIATKNKITDRIVFLIIISPRDKNHHYAPKLRNRSTLSHLPFGVFSFQQSKLHTLATLLICCFYSKE